MAANTPIEPNFVSQTGIPHEHRAEYNKCEGQIHHLCEKVVLTKYGIAPDDSSWTCEHSKFYCDPCDELRPQGQGMMRKPASSRRGPDAKNPNMTSEKGYEYDLEFDDDDNDSRSEVYYITTEMLGENVNCHDTATVAKILCDQGYSVRANVEGRESSDETGLRLGITPDIWLKALDEMLLLNYGIEPWA